MNTNVTLFRGAANVNIQGTTFTTIQNVQGGQDALVLVLDLLVKECCLGALLDSKERSDPPRCLPGTRAEAIRIILEWLKGSVPVLWLYGPAGDGKTAIAQTISEICRQEGRYCAGFFCSRISSATGRDDADRVIPTLLYQILLVIPQLQPHVLKVLQHHPGIFSLSKRAQMETLIVEPLCHHFEVTRFHGERPRRQLIIIDGLDECGDIAAQCELLNVIIWAAAELNTVGIHFLISSRPEFHIRRCFEKGEGTHDEIWHSQPLLMRLDLSKHVSTDTDIRHFLKECFSEIRRTHPIGGHLPPTWPCPRDVNALITRSSEHFLYLSTALKYIECHDERPDERFQVVLGLQSDPCGYNPFDSLDALYQHLFSSVNPRHLSNVLTLFGLIYIQNKSNPRRKIHGVYSKGFKEEGNSPYAFTQRVLYERMLDLRPGDIELMMKPLLSIIEFWPYPVNSMDPLNAATEMRLRVIHSSIFDFILDASRSAQFHLDISAVHRLVAEYFMKHVEFEGDITPGEHQTHTDVHVGPAPKNLSSSSMQANERPTISKVSLTQLDFLIDHLARSKTPMNTLQYNKMIGVINTVLPTLSVVPQRSHLEGRDFSSAISKCYCYLFQYFEEHCELSRYFVQDISQILYYTHPALLPSLESYVYSIEADSVRRHLETMLYMIKVGVPGVDNSRNMEPPMIMMMDGDPASLDVPSPMINEEHVEDPFSDSYSFPSFPESYQVPVFESLPRDSVAAEFVPPSFVTRWFPKTL